MRKRTLTAAALVLGLLLLLLTFRAWEDGTPEETSRSDVSPAASPSRPGRAAPVLPREGPERLATGGPREAGAEGALEVEVLAGAGPVSGARVRLYARGPRDPNLGEVLWSLRGSGTTDARGRVRLPAGPGPYLVAAEAPGLATRLGEVVRPVGEALTRLRLTLEAGQVLGGRTVVKGSGEPLPLVELSFIAHGRKLERWETAEAPEEERVHVTSDARGHFRVEGLAPGRWAVWARAPGHGRVFLPEVRVPAGEPLEVALPRAGFIEGYVVDAQGRPAAGAEVLVSAGGFEARLVTTGEGGGFSAEVEAGSHTVSARRGEEAGALEAPVVVAAGGTARDVRVRLGAGARLEGRVVARAGGAPVAGATVEVSPFGLNGDWGRTVTEGEGRFEVGGLAPGAYDVVVRAPGFSEDLRRGLTVAAGERFVLEVELAGTGVVEGTVRDSAGRPLEGVRVVGGDRWAEENLGLPLPEARSGEGGAYRLEGLRAGRVRLTARGEGMAMGVSEWVQLEEGGTARADFTLEETGTVEGVVRMEGGPGPAAPVRVYAGLTGRGGGDLGTVEVEGGGFFRLEVPAGDYVLVAEHAEEEGPRQSEPERVRVEAGKTVRVELALERPEGRRGWLRGRVEEPDGTPSAGALVTMRGPGLMKPVYFAVMADGEGRFEREVPEAVSLTVSAENGGRLGRVEEARAGREVVVRLEPAGVVRGRVVRPGGVPVRGFVLGVRRARERVQGWEVQWGGHEQRYGGDSFERRQLPGGELVLEATTEDGARGEAVVRLEAGGSAQVEIVLRARARVRGRVVEGAGRAPVADARVLLSSESTGQHFRTGADGRFVFEGVPEGAHSVRVYGEEGARASEEVLLKGDQELDLGDVLLEPLPSSRDEPFSGEE